LSTRRENHATLPVYNVSDAREAISSSMSIMIVSSGIQDLIVSAEFGISSEPHNREGKEETPAREDYSRNIPASDQAILFLVGSSLVLDSV
jgi:hypothetical protein